MLDFNLNFGGVIGALACGALAFVLAVACSPRANSDALSRLILLAIIGGALLGNYSWKIFFHEHNSDSDDDWDK